MPSVVLRNKTRQGIPLEATFLPEKGMNLISYKKGDVEIIDQSTRGLFEERYAGLGALIGPHFHRRHPGTIPPIKNESLFPHIAKVKAKGVVEPFSHGIGRYAPWKSEASETKIKASLNGKDEWNGVPLVALEGHNFTMTYNAELTPNGLLIDYGVSSDFDSVIGLHYYYALTDGRGTVSSDVRDTYNDQGTWKPISSSWNYDEHHRLAFDLSQEADYGFRPFVNPSSGSILLQTGAYSLSIQYTGLNEENSWQLYHPAQASFVCIEPLSAADPRKPILTASALKVLLEIL